MTISALPPLPNPGDPVAVFNVRAFEFWAGLPQFRTEANALAADVSQAWSLTGSARDAAAASAEAADSSSRAASASAELAAGFAGAAAFSAVAIYQQDAVVFSPSNRMLYRRKSAGSSANDPAIDAANWGAVTLAVGGNAVWHAGNLVPANYAALSGASFSGASSFAAGLTVNGGISVPSGGLSVGGQAVWHAGNLVGASIMYSRGVIDNSSLNTATGNGYYQIGYSGDSRSLLAFNAGGSAGPVQMEFSYQGNVRWRNQTDSANWTGWRELYHTGNFNPANYAPLTGVGTSGTWGISITGNAATAGGLAVASGRNNAANQIVRTNANGYIDAGWINTDSGDAGAGAIARVYASTDAYLRYYTMANFTDQVRTSAAGLWGINVSGNAASATLASKASTLAQGGGNGAAMTFHWSGQAGTPTWVWGGSDGTNHYVYNPANFSVNYATSAGTCSGNAATATSAGTAGSVSMSAGRTDGAAYPVVWGVSSSTSQLYSCSAVTIQSSTGTLTATSFGGVHMNLSGNIGAAGVINSGSTMTAAGKIFGNGAGNGLGAIYVTPNAGTPTFGADGDIFFVY